MKLLIEPLELVLTILILLTLLVELLPLLCNLMLIPCMISGGCRRYQDPASLHELLVGCRQWMWSLLGYDNWLIRDEHVCGLLIRIDVIGREA